MAKEGETKKKGFRSKEVAEVKSALRLAQAKTGKSVKECLAEALQDFFRKHNVPVAVSLDERRA